ncbi:MULTISPECIES: F0F1 ATP synthase subunit B [unclassified Gilliamella]|uniref:F0F1 ATP synthase subunit B n=1 Tax=unclassified Gilliamella TaxID=2685620 RepID=UPI001C69F205|nr:MULTISPECIES: F0F1 ATP synthase subunit B [unclassified Gilliamella]MCX8602157.1 F0F1 ATP synthase subunit B [Gilliamella sp. B3722]MCX8611370.1 F0F1 ATP synthase subunit B [Gilliamella sp. B3891]MCX8613800.1 F0F1 ATP synthase subunit B [Gilliamella sp. B3773]MCX8615116.1 F0F1 ATP synthase subunit B [Gilliamella sp. B3770]MCX8619005.1 F0F1 ATP synthase subunit B [Gilliamella sp. B2923]
MNMNATLLGQAITFVLFVWFCMKFVWPPVIRAIEKRQKEIADGLASAETAKKDLELAKANTSDIMQQAKVEANAIIEQANKRKAAILEEANQEASREKERIVAQGLAEVEAERKRAREELKQQVATLAIAGAEKIIERSVNEAANSDIIDKLVAEL